MNRCPFFRSVAMPMVVVMLACPVHGTGLPVSWVYENTSESGWHVDFPLWLELQVAAVVDTGGLENRQGFGFPNEERFVLASTGMLPPETPIDVTVPFDTAAAERLNAFGPLPPFRSQIGLFVLWSDGNKRVRTGRGLPPGADASFLTDAAITDVRFELDSFRFGPPEDPFFANVEPPTPDALFQFIGPSRVTFLPEPMALAPLGLLAWRRPHPARDN